MRSGSHRRSVRRSAGRSATVGGILAAACVAGAAPVAGAHGGHEGTLVEQHADRFDAAPGAPRYVLRAGAHTRRLTADQPRELVGQRVVAQDADPTRRDVRGRVAAAGAQRVAPAPVAGDRSVLVILLTAPDAPENFETPEDAQAVVFTGPTSANALFRQQSEGATRLVGLRNPAGDVAGPVALDAPLAGCGYDAIAQAGDRAAALAGWTPAAYDHVIYALPPTAACSWAGLGDLPGRRTWVNGALTTRVVAHELGHNLGSHHASALRCVDDTAPTTLSTTCASDEYGDPFDVMGGWLSLMSSWHRAQVGQLPGGQRTELRSSQTVTLQSASSFGVAGTRLLTIPRKEPGKAPSTWLAVELRSPGAPFDTWLSDAPVARGLTIRVVPDLTRYQQSTLIDAHPSTPGMDDAPLMPGESLTDTAYGITIRAEAGPSSNTLRAAVSMPATIDDVSPTAPGSVRVVGDTSGTRVSWSGSTDNDRVSHYEVQRDGVAIGTTPQLSFDDDRVEQLLRASYRVVAVDAAGNRGTSAPVQVELRDVTPPTAVGGLRARVADGRVMLDWTAAADNRAVAGYSVRRDDTTLPSTGALSSVDEPGPGTHRYVIRARDAAGNLGAPAEATVQISGPGSGTVGSGEGLGKKSGNGSDGSVGSQTTTRPARRAIVLRSWKRARRGLVTLRFSARGASSVSVYRGGHRIGRRVGSTLTVVVSRRRAPVRVVARFETGNIAATWSVAGRAPRRVGR